MYIKSGIDGRKNNSRPKNLKNFDKLPEDWIVQEKKEDKNRIICDYISGMTDRFATKLYLSLYE